MYNCSTGVAIFYNAHFGKGTGPILLDNLFCNSRETRLIDCPHSGVGVHNCFHSRDAGLRCQRKSFNKDIFTVGTMIVASNRTQGTWHYIYVYISTLWTLLPSTSKLESLLLLSMRSLPLNMWLTSEMVILRQHVTSF